MNSERLYTVAWQRPGDGQILVCTNLTIRQAAARCIRAIACNGGIFIHKVVAQRAGQEVGISLDPNRRIEMSYLNQEGD